MDGGPPGTHHVRIIVSELVDGGRFPTPQTRPQLEAHGPAYLHRAGLIGELRAVQGVDTTVVGGDLAETGGVVPDRHDAGHAMILEIGSSMMSDAPASLSAGMSVLMLFLATTVSTA